MLHHKRATHDNPDYVPSKKPQPKPRHMLSECPVCGGEPTLSRGRFGIRAEHCGLWSWNGKPLVGKETHIARINAHSAFDPIWKSGRLSRGECYRRLQVEMGMSEEDCHISVMDERQATRVVEIVNSGALEHPRHDRKAA